MQTLKAELKALVRGAYDLQKLRIEMGNRIVGNFKIKLGQEPGTKEDDLSDDAKVLLAELRRVYKRIADGMKHLTKRQFKADGLINTYAEFSLVGHYATLSDAEDQQVKDIAAVVQDFSIWEAFMQDVKGCGPMMAAVIISEIDIEKARYPSSLWKYAGLDVAADGAGRSRRQEHLTEYDYTDKNGKPARRKGITFNPFLKTKLVGVLGTSFLKQPADKCVYRELYDNYKHRMENHTKWGTANDGEKDENGHAVTSKGRRHNMAVRYAVKRFLADLYRAWRTIEGLPVEPEYHEAKLGHRHVA